jgi:hypothetical protein
MVLRSDKMTNISATNYKGVIYLLDASEAGKE